MSSWQQVKRECQENNTPLIVAHRGVPVLEPENTLRSFSLALTQNAFALETDLRITRDDEIILFHDSTLDRTTDGQGRIQDQSLKDIKRLRAKNPDQKGMSDQQIPTLAELIQYTHANTPLLLELKDPLFQKRKYAEKLVQTLSDFGMLESTALASFHFSHVLAIREVCPTIPIGYITMYNPFPFPDAQLLGPLWPLLLANPFYVSRAHKRGSLVCPLDPNPESRMGFYMALGVDAVLSNYPARSIAAMRSHSPVVT